MGMARTFQNIRLFSELSVIDNVKIAYNMHVTYNLLMPSSVFAISQLVMNSLRKRRLI